jgi:hypothetical protein
MRLAEAQDLFWSLASREARSQMRDAGEVFVGTPRLDAASRMEIYADMFVWRQIDVLREDFPKLVALMGDEEFYALGEAYVRAHPSEHYSLSKFGRHLALFLQERPLGRPDLSDMAALEWARAEVFEEAVVPVASPECLRSLARADFANQRLLVVPAMRLLRLQHDVLETWRRIEDGAAVSMPRRSVTFAAVWRKEFDIFHVRLEAEEAGALERAMAGETIGVVCEAFGNRPDAVDAALRAVGSWFAEGWIAQPSGERRP